MAIDGSGCSAMSDRDAVRIAREVREHRFGSRKGTLGIYDPFAGTQRREPPGKGGGVGEAGVLAEELQLATVVSCFKGLKEAAPEQAREYAHRQEEARPAGDPLLTVG